MYVYLLHFPTPHHHARHYLGCTADLRARLTRHATGDGARILRTDLDIDWELVRCWIAQTYSPERCAKSQHGSGVYCPLCRTDPRTIPGSIEMHIKNLRIPLRRNEYL